MCGQPSGDLFRLLIGRVGIPRVSDSVSVKFSWEFNFVDCLFFVSCGNKF